MTQTTGLPDPEQDAPVRRRRIPPISGFSFASFGVLLAVVLAAGMLDVADTNLLVMFGVTMILGALLTWAGSRVPVLSDFGLPIILCLLVPALLVHWGWMPQSYGTMMTDFYSDLGLIDFIVVAVIVGSIAGLPRTLLIKILVRFIVPLAGVVVVTFAVGAVVGMALGYSWLYSILFIIAPVMAGGLPMGALPMSEMYATQLETGAEQFLSLLMSAVVIANTFCILVAAVLNGLGKKAGKRFLGFNGEGQLLRVRDEALDGLTVPPPARQAGFTTLAQGLMICAAVMLTGLLLTSALPVLHQYAWMVVLMALVKIFNLFPEDWNRACSAWGDFIIQCFIPGFLVALSVGIISIEEIINAVSDPRYVAMVAITVLITAVVSGALGWLVKFHAIEAAITPGLIMADMGGSGDVAVLSAADRMNLMPFAAIATRFGGVLVLFLSTLLVPLLTPAALP